MLEADVSQVSLTQGSLLSYGPFKVKTLCEFNT